MHLHQPVPSSWWESIVGQTPLHILLSNMHLHRMLGEIQLERYCIFDVKMHLHQPNNCVYMVIHTTMNSSQRYTIVAEHSQWLPCMCLFGMPGWLSIPPAWSAVDLVPWASRSCSSNSGGHVLMLLLLFLSIFMLFPTSRTSLCSLGAFVKISRLSYTSSLLGMDVWCFRHITCYCGFQRCLCGLWCLYAYSTCPSNPKAVCCI